MQDERLGVVVRFSNDVDLLKWEPVLFRELFLSSQTLCQGADGLLSGTTFTSGGASFSSAAAAAGNVIYLSSTADSIDGCYEIVSVDSATQLTISVVRQRSDDDSVAPPGGSSIAYRISTFDPQAEEAAYSLLQYFGIGADDEGTLTEGSILQSRALRQASVFAVLASVFAGSACGADDPEGYWQKSLRYQTLFNKARVKARVKIDTDADNEAEEFRSGGAVRLRRL